MNQKEELFKSIWKIAEKLRGKVDGWDFKSYILCILFFRYISEDITKCLNKNESSDFNYANLNDNEVPEDVIIETIKEKGFFIKPSQLFVNVVKNAKNNKDDLNINITNIFRDIENSSKGYESERNLKGIFYDIDFNSPNLGSSAPERNKHLYEILTNIAEIKLDLKDSDNDIFGDAYEYLMGMYASNAGKSGGEYFTPQEVSKLLTKLAIGNKKEIKNVYDPACGSGSLLLQAAKILGDENVTQGYYGQESNITTYNLCRMNMFLHNINCSNFDIELGDTLIDPKHALDNKYEVIVSNPPYSIKWEGDDNPTLINDVRYAPAGILAPKSKSDYAFIMHALYLLATNGKAAIVCFPGIFYRGGAEQKIRQYLVNNNYIDLIINLPDNLFYGTSISTCIMVLNKSKLNHENNIMFIDATREFEKRTNQNILSEDNINKILNTYLERKEIDHFSKIVELDTIKENDYNLSVSNYIEQENNKEVIDINVLNSDIDRIVKRNDELRTKINEIIKELNHK